MTNDTQAEPRPWIWTRPVMAGIDMSFTRHPCPACTYDGGSQGHRLLVPDGDPPGRRTAVCRACGRLYTIPVA